MSTLTGNCLESTNHYGDEVLNANWLPLRVLSSLGFTQGPAKPQRSAKIKSERDAADFMQRLYQAQE